MIIASEKEWLRKDVLEKNMPRNSEKKLLRA